MRRFVKAHGAGNDFVLLPDLDDELELDDDLVRALCDRHRGIGGDGVIRLGAARPGVDADVFMDYRNADGGVAEMCGNGVRCVAKWAADRGVVAGDVVRVDTRGGVKPVEVVGRDDDGRVIALRVDMGAPRVLGKAQVDVSPQLVVDDLDLDLPLGVDLMAAVTTESVSALVLKVSMGNPHAVLVCSDLARAPVRTLGPYLERHPEFPEGTNVEFIEVPASPTRVRGRIWERGVGETMASGTGASAMAVGAHLLADTDRRLTVELPGGELEAHWTDETMFISGGATEVAEGTLGDDWLAAVHPKGRTAHG